MIKGYTLKIKGTDSDTGDILKGLDWTTKLIKNKNKIKRIR